MLNLEASGESRRLLNLSLAATMKELMHANWIVETTATRRDSAGFTGVLTVYEARKPSIPILALWETLRRRLN